MLRSTNCVETDAEECDVIGHVTVHGDAVIDAPDQVLDVCGEDPPTVALPADGGWGWVVVAAAFLANLIVDGVTYTFGIIMPQLLDHFEAGKGKTALVGSLIPGVYLIVGNG